MLLYRDFISGDEMLSDSYKIAVTHDLFFEVVGKRITEKGGVDSSLIGANASAEDGGEDLEEGSTTECDIVLANKLKELFLSKEEYKKSIKKYIKRVLAHLEKNKPERVEAFKAASAKAIKEVVLANFTNWQFYTGEKQDEEGMIALLDYKEDGITPYMLFFKDGLLEEKC